MPQTDAAISSASMTNVEPIKKGPDWKALTDEYAQGASDVEIAVLLGISLTDFYEMERDIPEFATFASKGRTLSQAWWVGRSRANLWNKEFNTALYNFNMKNRYGWADKIEAKDTSEESVRDADTLKAEVFKAAKKLGAKYPDLLRELGEEGA